jgi:hypothetical protein
VPDKLSLSFGAVYLDRADLPLLPAVGLTWNHPVLIDDQLFLRNATEAVACQLPVK